ncbi:unnamed protein product [Cylicocyclus nassatus]|uniref:Uncharacterized protein n=1 Tax=Cylicocyclus nassatus TaxID=53992 RepID=A0AA36H544_CYLNA|nr:unnamed protein product [Cylicocyclus nassatus]
MNGIELLAFILISIRDETPIMTDEPTQEWKKHQQRLMATLLEELTGMSLAQLWPEDITKWCQRLFSLATSRFNGSCGQNIPNHNRWRLHGKNARELRFPCSRCPREECHTLYNHLLYRYNYKLQARRAPVFDFWSPCPAALLAFHPEQIWLVFARLPRQALQPDQKLLKWDEEEQQDHDTQKHHSWDDEEQQPRNAQKNRSWDEDEERDRGIWKPHPSKLF